MKVVVSLLDLHGLDAVADPVLGVAERVARAKKQLEEQVNHERFRAHFAVHELETWLLSDHTIFPKQLQAAVRKKCGAPETVNFDAPPKRLLNELYRKHLREPYNQVTDGAELFARLDPNVAYEKCPHLAMLFDDPLALARDEMPLMDKSPP